MPKTRRDIEELISADVNAILGPSFDPVDADRPVDFLDDVSGLLATTLEGRRTQYALRWRFRGVHTRVASGQPDPAHPVGPTGNAVTVDGMTILEFADDDDAQPQLAMRYIDWLAAYAQLGIVGMARPSAGPTELVTWPPPDQELNDGFVY